MHFYTFFLEYRGGTYISQFEALTPAEALETWLNQHDHSVVGTLKPKHIRKIRQDYEEDGFVALVGVTHVWCFTFHIKRHLGLLNFTLTSRD